jgi:hypothetical protein
MLLVANLQSPQSGLLIVSLASFLFIKGDIQWVTQLKKGRLLPPKLAELRPSNISRETSVIILMWALDR